MITARGGSKGLPRKNVLEVGGKPLLAWTVEAALACGERLHRVILSTDDEEIADVGRRAGVEGPFRRPAHLASDSAGHVGVLQHAVAWVEADEGAKVDWVLTLQPTTPLRTSADILAALDLVATDPAAESVIGVTVVEHGHPAHLRRVVEGRLLPYVGQSLEAGRRQDCEPKVYRNTGAIYVTRRDVLMERGRIHGDVSLAYEMPAERAVDIDTEIELRLADLLLRARTPRS